MSDTIVELAAIERGAGSPVTLIHGGVFHSGPAWAKTIGPLVQGGYRVIAVDRRGYGRSPAGDADHIPVSLQARDVAQTLDLREVESSHVAGVSYGALVGLELALARPERVLSLTLVEPGEATPMLTAGADGAEVLLFQMPRASDRPGSDVRKLAEGGRRRRGRG